jgi:hypothetical protein
LTITKVSSTVTLATCEVCHAKYKCYLPNPDQARWEMTTWFEGLRAIFAEFGADVQSPLKSNGVAEPQWKYRPQQSVCSRPECQRQRRTDYHRKKLATDTEYHQVALESQKQWREEHPDYQKQWRRQNPQRMENNRERQRQRDQKRRLRRRLLDKNNLALDLKYSVSEEDLASGSDARSRLEQAIVELQQLDEILLSGNLEPHILAEFRDALNRVRNAAWVAQQSVIQNEIDQDSRSVLSFLVGERVRAAYQLCQAIGDDLKI